MFALQLVVTLLFIIFIPESPAWLFIMQGSNSTRGIATINYMAKFNGS